MKLLLLATWILLLFGCGDNQEKNLSGSVDNSKQKFEWKMVTTWPKNYPGLGLGAENFANKKGKGIKILFLFINSNNFFNICLKDIISGPTHSIILD